ncbi:MAG: response regulator [Desulfobulbaceae bacterium]|nr:response regulator [Desulfobulbaceae bacterium]
MAQASILIVDDEELIRESLRHDMLDHGYAADLASSGEEALALLEKEYDLIITDLIMEGMSGLEMLRLAKERRPEQAVFILTGYGELESAISALRLGAEDYLLKPYKHEELIFRIDKFLSSRKMLQTMRVYESLLSICSECKKIRDDEPADGDEARWISIEQFVCKATGSDLSHGFCPECYRKKKRELNEMMRGGHFIS